MSLIHTGRGDPNADKENDGLLLGNTKGCGRDSKQGLNTALDVVSTDGSLDDSLGLLFLLGIENKAGVDVLRAPGCVLSSTGR